MTMRTCIPAILYLAIIAPTVGAAPPSLAFNTAFGDRFFAVDHKGGSGKNRAAAQAKAQYGGKVLSVSEATQNGQVVYKVKLLLDSGRIKIVKIRG